MARTCARCGFTIPDGLTTCPTCGLVSQATYLQEQLDTAIAGAYEGHIITPTYERLRAYLGRAFS